VPSSPPPSVSLVILNLNGLDHLTNLLPTVEQLDYPAERLQVIVTDNSSRDGSMDFVRSRHPRCEVVALDANYGFAEGNNRGAAQATGEWLGFLNNDLRLPPSWLRDMMSLLDRQPDATAIASKIVNWDGTRIDYVGSRINFQGHGVQLDEGERSSEWDYERRILAPCGGAMLVRRDAFERLQGWDPDFFAFFEDVDLGWRLNLLGYDCWYNPGAEVYHRLHGTVDTMQSHRIRVLYERNSLFTLYKCLDDEHLAAILPAALYLLNERALMTSGVDRREYEIEGRPDAAAFRGPVPAAGAPPATSSVARAFGSLRRRGVRRTVRRAAATVGRRLARLSDMSTPITEDTVTVPRLALGPYVGLSEFAHSLDRMTEKRRWLQANRKRTDQEIIEINGDFFAPVHTEAGFEEFYEWLVETVDLRRRLGPTA
jgi:GT2 family glycosyltransferase